MAKFDPKKDGDKALIANGDYEGLVKSIENGKGKTSGKDMLIVVVTIYLPTGETTLTDYIPTDPDDGMLWKLKRLCQATNCEDAWNTGDTDEAAKAVFESNRSMTVVVGTQPAKGQYEASNKIVGYKSLNRASGGQAVLSGGAPPLIGEGDIPF